MPALWIRDDIAPQEPRRLAKLEKNPRAARQPLAIVGALDGLSRETAARIAGMDRQTLRDWVIRCNRAGPDGLSDHWCPDRRFHAGSCSPWPPWSRRPSTPPP